MKNLEEHQMMVHVHAKRFTSKLFKRTNNGHESFSVCNQLTPFPPSFSKIISTVVPQAQLHLIFLLLHYDHHPNPIRE